MKAMAAAARQRLDLDLDVGELAVAAGLPLEARMLRGAARGSSPCRAPAAGAPTTREIVLRAQPVERDLEMDVALAPQHHLLRSRHCARATSVGSSSISLAMAPESFTSSLRFSAVIARPKTGFGSGELAAARRAPRRCDSTVPVAMPSSRASATISPGPAAATLSMCGAGQPQHAGDAHAVEAHAFGHLPRQTRASDSLPVCGG